MFFLPELIKDSSNPAFLANTKSYQLGKNWRNLDQIDHYGHKFWTFKILLIPNLWVIGQYFFPQYPWPSLIICIDLFVVFLMGGGGCRYFVLKTGIRLIKKIFYEVRLYHYLDPYSATLCCIHNIICICCRHYFVHLMMKIVNVTDLSMSMDTFFK